MEIVLACLLVGLVSSIPIEGPVEGFDARFPEEVPGLFEGDIVLQPGQDPYQRNSVRNAYQKWPQGVIPYEIESSYTSTVKSVFMDAMHEIMEKSKVNGKNCITFQPRHSESSYIRFSKGTGCHTPVGDIHRRSAVTIGHGCERKGTVMHELLHALGFWHEQSRHDRDQYVTIHLENVQHGHESNFNKYPESKIDELGQSYDYDSIMHYGAYSFAIDRSKPTIVPKVQNAVIGQRDHLSATDIKEIQIEYGCIPRPSGSGTGFHTSAPATLPPNTGGETLTFQTGLGSWSQPHSSSSTSTTWRVHAGKTPSSGTGPTADHLGSTTGKYLYIEASGHYGKTAKLDSHAFPGGDYCFSFYYNMYGSKMGYLKLNVVSGTHKYTLKTWTGNQGQAWHGTRLNAHIHTSGTFKFEFEGHTGTGFSSDIAIDDIQIHSGNC